MRRAPESESVGPRRALAPRLRGFEAQAFLATGSGDGYRQAATRDMWPLYCGFQKLGVLKWFEICEIEYSIYGI